LLEIHLQQLWSDKRLPFHAFHLINGSPIEICQPGIWNKAGSGPDFELAKIRLDGLTWFGSVEFHLKSSDWYKHQHHKDEAYENVILHVVYEYDQPVYSNQSLLPTLELKSYLVGEFKFPSNYSWKIDPKIHCKQRIKEFPLQFQIMQHEAIKARIKRKYTLGYSKESNILHAYSIISKAFGTKSNSLSFELLTHQIPLSHHFNHTEQEILDIVLRNDQGWKGRNLHLTKKLESRIISWNKFTRWFFNRSRANLSESDWKEGFEHAQINSKLLRNNLLINAKTYIDLHAFRVQTKNQNGLLHSMKFLQSLSPESNRITSLWKGAGIVAKNALESQANLEIYQQFCTRNKCLNCSVGQQITKK
jgi:hypothetical protein